MKPRESAPTHPPVTEKLVAHLWEQQRSFVLPLVATDGTEIQVVYRGRRRWDRGPDFTGALISIAGADLCHGDVEVHVRSSDWRAHGHHRDRNYSSVILQVVLWDDTQQPTVRADGVAVPVLAIAPLLSTPLETLIDASRWEAPLPIPCWSGDLEKDSPLADLLDRCGIERFVAKAARFESDLTCASPDQLLYQGIATALGYSHNSAPFRRLAELLPIEVLMACRTRRRGDAETRGAGTCSDQHSATSFQQSAISDRHSAPSPVPWRASLITHHSSLITAPQPPTPIEALLMGAAGLLPSQRGLSVEADPYVEALEECWATDGARWVGDSMKASEWRFFRVRPANFPTRRVAALASLVDRWPVEGLAETLVRLIGTVQPRKAPRALEALLLEGAQSDYWERRCDFGFSLRRSSSLIGRQRAAEVIVNVFLPFLAAWASQLGDPLLGPRAEAVYRCYPKRGDNEIARYTAFQITGQPRPRLARSACRQQGLLHLYWSYCEAKDCGECPVASPAAASPITLGRRARVAALSAPR